jgi:CRP/FNR family transcriptional regulator
VEQKLQLIQRIPYFAELDQHNRALIELASASREERYEKEQILFLEGEVCRGMYYLVSGQARIFKSGTGGREQILRIAGPGSVFNDVPVLDGGPNPASVDALEACAVLILPTAAVQRLLDHEPAVVRAIMMNLASKLRQLTTLVGDISLKQVTSRVAKILLNQVEEGNHLESGLTNQVTTQMTQQQMAAMAGTVREMVGRALKTLESSGAIETRRSQVIIKDANKLEDFSNS